MKLVVCLLIIAASSGFTVLGQTTFTRSNDGTFKIEPGRSFQATQNRDKTAANAVDRSIVGDVSEAIKILQENHYLGERLTDEYLTTASVTEMLHTLDPHSNFYSTVQFSELLEGHRSFYSGIGIQLSQFNVDAQPSVFVISVNKNSPAEIAGLKFGDKIVAVDDTDAKKHDTHAIRELIRGENNTPVRILVERPNKSRETVVVKRAKVDQPSIPDHFMLNSTTGYIELTGGFTYTTYTELKTSIASLKKMGMRSLVLDLRGNTGGILEQSIKVADTFLPEGKIIVSQKGRFDYQTRTWRSTKKLAESMPLAILVDENTASASEIVAGALQDHDRALIIGTKTFGKGLVQNIIPLSEGAGLALTTARYYTPSGRSIQRDYSTMGRYEYYSHRSVAKNEKPTFTSNHRKVYGGDGIMPDISLRTNKVTARQSQLLDPIFSFVRKQHVPNGIYSVKSTLKVASIDDETVNAFINYARQNFQSIPSETFTSENDFIKNQLMFYYTAAESGYMSATRLLIYSDPQTIAAINKIKDGVDLASTENLQKYETTK